MDIFNQCVGNIINDNFGLKKKVTMAYKSKVLV